MRIGTRRGSRSRLFWGQARSPAPHRPPPGRLRYRRGTSEAAAAHAARGRRPLIVVAAAVGLALVAGGGFAMLRSGSASFTGATPHPTPTAAPVVTVDAHPADFETLSATSEAALLTAAFESMSSPAAVKARDDLLAAPDASLPVPSAGNLLLDANDREDGAATNGNGAYVRAHPARVGDGGTLQLHVVTKQPASWSWRVLVMNRSTHVVRTAFVVVGAQDHGQLQSASLMLGRDEVPAGMRLSVAPRTPYFWTAALPVLMAAPVPGPGEALPPELALEGASVEPPE